jgi:hypothetical protein
MTASTKRRKLVASSPTLHLQSPLHIKTRTMAPPGTPPKQTTSPTNTLTTHIRSNPKHTSRALGRKGLLQKVHRAQAPLERCRRGQRCRSPAQSPLEQSDYEDAPRTRVLARATRKASAKHHRWSRQTCQQQQCQQRLEAATEATKLPPTDLRT